MADNPSAAWGNFSTWLATLPEEARREYARQMYSFVHDLRQPLAQTQSAEELLRRTMKNELQDEKLMDDLIELLDIIKEANRRASDQVSSFVEAFLEGIEPPDSIH